MKLSDFSFSACLSKYLTTSVICIIMGIFFVMPAHASVGTFPIASNSASMHCGFDGTNYLVGLENHTTSPATIGAQLIDSNGAKVDGLISPSNNSGISTNVAFDGTNYLLIWEYDPGGTGPGRFQIYGQFISKSGSLVGSSFAISSTGIWFDGVKTMAFGGGKYLVTYTRLIDPALGEGSTNRYIAGRMVSPDGSTGEEFRISSGYGDASDVAFDGTNFFVVWTEDQYDYEIRGRFVSTNGVPGTEISVNASLNPSDNPKSVTFDGTNYMVIWSDAIDQTKMLDVFGQQVSTSGALVGGVITITNENGPQMATTVAFDGINYLATWVDMTNASDWNLYGQYIKASDGSLVGSKFAISSATTNQMGGAGFVHGKYLALINTGVVMGESGISSVSGVDGLFITPVSAPTAPTVSSLSPSSGTIGSTITITGTNFVSGATTVTFNGILSINVIVTNSGQLTATVPSGATTGPIKVITSGGSATSTDFTLQKTLSINFSGSGSGTVKSTSPVISCLSPNPCHIDIAYLTPVTLSTQVSLGSTFSGWSDGCTGTNDCSLTMDGDKSVTAAFTVLQYLKNETTGTYYGTVQAALNGAFAGQVVRALAISMPDTSVTFNTGESALFHGGFSTLGDVTPTGYTTVKAPFTISSGSLVLDRLLVN